MEGIFIGLGRFLQVTTIFLFDSWCMYPFCGTLTSVFTAFLCVFGSLLLPIGVLFWLMLFFYLTLSLLDDH